MTFTIDLWSVLHAGMWIGIGVVIAVLILGWILGDMGPHF